MTEDSGLAQKLRRFINFSDAELAALTELERLNVRTVKARTELIEEGRPRQDCYILQEGWAACYKLLPDGRRQVINFSIQGDFLGLRSFLLRTADHSVVTITKAKVARLPQRRILEVIDEHPRLGAAILWSVSREEAIVVEHLVNIGRRSALERTAHLLLELDARLELVGHASDAGFACPLTQDDLADALGLTAIHVNRVLRQLREHGLVSLRERHLVIQDIEGLRELAQFSFGYLDQNGGNSGPVAAN